MTAKIVNWRGAELVKQIESATPDALFEAAKKLAEAAAAKAPRNSGDLAASAYAASATQSTYSKAKNHRKQIKVKEGEAVAAFAVFYARFIELGTKKVSARPFLRPALDELRGTLGKDIATTIGKRLK